MKPSRTSPASLSVPETVSTVPLSLATNDSAGSSAMTTTTCSTSQPPCERSDVNSSVTSLPLTSPETDPTHTPSETAVLTNVSSVFAAAAERAETTTTSSSP